MIVAPECVPAHIRGLQIETPFAIPDTTQSSFRDDRLCFGIAPQPIPILRTMLEACFANLAMPFWTALAARPMVNRSLPSRALIQMGLTGARVNLFLVQFIL